MRRVAVLFHRLGPYHHARLRAFGGLCDLTAVELSAVDDTYAWEVVGGADGFRRVTLFREHDAARAEVGQVLRRVHVALDAARPEVVAVPGWSGRGALAALLWCRRAGVPAVLLSESAAGDEPRVWWKEWVKRRVVRQCRAALVGGRPHRDYVVRLGMPEHRVFVGYDVVDNDHFRRGAAAARAQVGDVRRRLGLPARYFLASSRFVAKKNLDTLLRAYARYREQAGAAAWDLVLLGDGELRPELLRLRDELGQRDHVLLPGFKQYAELPAYYGLAGAFVHASSVEQWGLVVNEALAAGLPVLVSERCGCVPDLVRDGFNGFTFEPRDADALARLMARVAGDGCHPAALGRVGAAIIARWTPAAFAHNLARACDAALHSRRAWAGLLGTALLGALARRGAASCS